MFYIEKNDKPNWLIKKANIIKVEDNTIILPIYEKIKPKGIEKLAKKTNKIIRKNSNSVKAVVSKEIQKEKQRMLVQDINEYNRIKKHLKTYLIYKKAQNEKAIQEITDNRDTWANKTPSEYSDIVLQEIYRKNNNNIDINFIKFKFCKHITDFYGVIIVDNANRTFEVLESTIQEYEDAKLGKVNEIYLNLTTIDKKTYNVIKNVPNRITEQEKVKLYFDDYITKAIYYSEEAYNNINEEYKSKKYDTIEKYKTYLNENRQTLLNSEQKGIKSYAVKKYADYEQYVCVDNYDNYYIFNVQGAMSYNIILDTYTVDLPQFVEKYNKASDKEKAILNIKKIFQAINLKDYNYVYNKLDTDFKNRYFKQESEFEKFADSNFFSKNEITIKEYEQIQNTHVFTVSVKNAEDKNANTKDKKIIMQLKEGTEYVMSFSVN